MPRSLVPAVAMIVLIIAALVSAAMLFPGPSEAIAAADLQLGAAWLALVIAGLAVVRKLEKKSI